MKITLIKIGKPVENASRVLVEKYTTRLASFCKFESVELKDFSSNEKKIQKSSVYSALMSNKSSSSDFIVALDEKGVELSSKELSAKLQGWMDNPSVKNLFFVIGGPYGLDPRILERANLIWCLSSATLPSDLAWILTSEQIYRGFTILNNTPYHHE